MMLHCVCVKLGFGVNFCVEWIGWVFCVRVCHLFPVLCLVVILLFMLSCFEFLVLLLLLPCPVFFYCHSYYSSRNAVCYLAMQCSSYTFCFLFKWIMDEWMMIGGGNTCR